MAAQAMPAIAVAALSPARANAQRLRVFWTRSSSASKHVQSRRKAQT